MQTISLIAQTSYDFNGKAAGLFNAVHGNSVVARSPSKDRILRLGAASGPLVFYQVLMATTGNVSHCISNVI
jgi:hypothetical protein